MMYNADFLIAAVVILLLVLRNFLGQKRADDLNSRIFLFFAVLVSDERKQILQLAMAVGIGFAILENAFLLLTYVDEVDIGWAIARGISTSLSHGICTLTVGCGIIFVRKQKKLFYTGTFALLALAMTFHATFNLLIQSQYDYVALALPIVIYAVFWIVRLKGRQLSVQTKI